MQGPTTTLESGPERRSAVAELVESVRRELPRLHSAPTLAPRHFAALGVARAARLLDGMQHLVSGGYVDLAGVLARSIIEVYAVSLYCLYGGEDAYDHVRGAYVRGIGLLPDVGDLAEAKELADRWDGPIDKINWEDLIKRRLPVLVPDPNQSAVRRWHELLYDVTYRKYSQSDVHAGVGAMGSHMVRTPTSLGVAAVRYSPDDGTMDLITAGALLGLLASRVYAVFGLSRYNMNHLLATIAHGLSAEDLVVSGDWRSDR